MKARVVANIKSARPVRGMPPRDRGERGELRTTAATRSLRTLSKHNVGCAANRWPQ